MLPIKISRQFFYMPDKDVSENYSMQEKKRLFLKLSKNCCCFEAETMASLHRLSVRFYRPVPRLTQTKARKKQSANMLTRTGEAP